MFTNKLSNKATGILAMLAASVCFALGGLLIKLIPWNALAINGVRNLIGCLVVGLYIRLIHHKLRFNRVVLAGMICVGGETTLFTVANKLTTAGNAIVLQYTAPVWIILMMFLFFGKKPEKREIISILIVLSGILCFFIESLSAGRILGDLSAVLSGILYGGIYILNRFDDGDTLSSMFLGQLACGILCSPAVRGESNFSPAVLAAILVLGIVQVGFAFIFLSIGTSRVDPVTASIINALEPVLNPILVAVFYGETLGPTAILGAVIVIGAILFYNITAKK